MYLFNDGVVSKDCVSKKTNWLIVKYDMYESNPLGHIYPCCTSKYTFSYLGDFQNQLFIHLLVVIRYADLRFKENGRIRME